LLENYGVENISFLKETKDKISYANKKCSKKSLEKRIKTVKEKFGKSNVFQVDEIKSRTEKTNMEKYGVKSHTQAEYYRPMMEDIFLKKYGVSHPSKYPEIRNKLGPQSDEAKKRALIKRESTCISKYGVRNPTMNSAILDKALKAGFKRKEYIWKTGEISLLQWYEPIILKELEDSGYVFSDILTELSDMPLINYYFEGIEHRYYPDFYIPSKNIIIEVKSDWTLNLEWDKNQAKFEATKSLGFDFRLEVR